MLRLWLGLLLGFFALAVVGVCLAGSAIAVNWIIQYQTPIMIGILAIGAILLLTNCVSLRQVIGFAETIKPITDPSQIAKIGDKTQSWFTRVIVGGVRKRLERAINRDLNRDGVIGEGAD